MLNLSLAPLLLGLAVLGCYWTMRLARGRLASALLPLAGVVVTATIMQHSEIALGTAIGGALAILGLVIPLVILQAPPRQPAPPRAAAWWPLLLPAGMAVFLVGLSGEIEWRGASALTALGLAALPACWRARTARPMPLMPEMRSGDAPSEAPRASALWLAGLLVAMLVMAVSAGVGYAAVKGTLLLAARHPFAPAGLIAACVLGPASCMPMLGVASQRAAEEDPYLALSSCLRVCLLSILFAPPLVFAVEVCRQSFDWQLTVPFPGTLWRIELVLLLAMAAMLVPVAAGKTILRRLDGLILLAIYVIYLALSALFGVRILG